MEDEVVSLDTAIMMSDLGFDVLTPVICYIDDNGNEDYTRRNYSEVDSCYVNALRLYYKYNRCGRCYLIPTQSLAQRWMREVHNVRVTVTDSFGLDGCVQYLWKVNGCFIHGLKDGLRYRTYEEALERGLLYALKNFVNNKKQNNG